MSRLDSITEKNSESSLKSAIILSQISLVLMIVVSVIGLFTPGMYAKDSTWAKATFLGNDLVNLCIFTPLLFIAIVLYKRGTYKGKLFWLGMQALMHGPCCLCRFSCF